MPCAVESNPAYPGYTHLRRVVIDSARLRNPIFLTRGVKGYTTKDGINFRLNNLTRLRLRAPVLP